MTLQELNGMNTPRRAFPRRRQFFKHPKTLSDNLAPDPHFRPYLQRPVEIRNSPARPLTEGRVHAKVPLGVLNVEPERDRT